MAWTNVSLERVSLNLADEDRAKRACALAAAELVESGMKVGLGTGSTAAILVDRLGERVRGQGLDIEAVPTSRRTEARAREAGIRIVSLDQVEQLDLTIDGADEFDPQLRLIKGGGGAHLREKVVAAASSKFVAIADASKRVEVLGAFPLPVEALAYGLASTWRLVREALADLGYANAPVGLRARDPGKSPIAETEIETEAGFETDEGNRVLDLRLGRIDDPEALSVALNAIPGVVENGLFLGLCDSVLVGHPDGSVDSVSASESGLVRGTAT